MKKALSTLLIVFTCFSLTIRPVFAGNFVEDFASEILNSAATNLGKFSVETIFRTCGTILYALVGYGSPWKFVVDSNDNPDSYYGRGIIPSTVTYTASLINRPVKTVDYVAYVMQNTHLVPQAYAQGVGFSGLSPILQVWKLFRNIVYFCFIIVFVIIGFMIMFRKKVSSNTIVTIQEALPRLIVTLLLVTFSYAIAGFVIDIMYFSIYLIAGVMTKAGFFNNTSGVTNAIFSRNILNIGFTYLIGWTEPAGVAAESMGNLVSIGLGGLAGVAANVIFYLIFAVAIIIAVFKTFIQLVTAYIGIIFSAIFAPIQILPNAFPGSDAFQKWLRGLIANAAVFPVAVSMVLLGLVLSTTPGLGDSGTAATAFGINTTNTGAAGFDKDGFIPPLLFSSEIDSMNKGWAQTFGQSTGEGSVSAIKALIGFGFIMMLPEVVKMTKKALEVKEEPYGDTAAKNAQAGWAMSPVGIAGGLFMERQKSVLIQQGLQYVPIYKGAIGTINNIKAKISGSRTSEGDDTGVGAQGIKTRTVTASPNPAINAMRKSKTVSVTNEDLNNQEIG